ncbi:MAG TPA: PilN domain-containing protein [Terriglobales bacterium]|nr:PilN domain-containing protein [Terriglobales bacterium]
MIRINLLGGDRPKKAKGPAITLGTKEPPNIMVVAALIAALTVGGNYLWFWGLNKKAEDLKKQLDVAQTENRRLADVKAKYLERQKQFDLYDRRVKVIHQLQANQSGPTDLMNALASTVNSTDAVWLNTMNDTGAVINLQGTALSSTAVANLMTNLKKSNYFKSIEIKETYQDEQIKDMQAFQFSITCEKLPPQQGAPAPTQQKS